MEQSVLLNSLWVSISAMLVLLMNFGLAFFYAGFSFCATYFILIILNKTIGLRVHEKEELDGLDITEENQ